MDQKQQYLELISYLYYYNFNIDNKITIFNKNLFILPKSKKNY
jgi:hypothetical protein